MLIKPDVHMHISFRMPLGRKYPSLTEYRRPDGKTSPFDLKYLSTWRSDRSICYLWYIWFTISMVRTNVLLQPWRRAVSHAVRPRTTIPAYQSRCFRATARSSASDKSQSFKNQLYESTQQRLKRERAEQERFSQYQTQSPGGRYAALMFGMRLAQGFVPWVP